MTEIVQTRMGVITYLVPSGPLTDEDGPSTLDNIVENCLKSHEINLVIDLARVPTVTGVIIETFLDMQDKLSRFGGYLKVVNANTLIKDIFTICSFGDFVSAIDDS